MSDQRPRGTSRPATPETPLETLRIKLGKTEVVRTLSGSYRGLMTHWWHGRSRYCPQDDTCEHHDQEAVWKGYCCVEQWVQAGQMWVPKVLEITESLDQDFHGRFRRAQVWEITHLKTSDKKKSGKFQGKLWQQLEEAHVPLPYNMQAVLDNLYHFIGVRLDTDNPLPRRVMVHPSKGDPPRKPGEEAPSSPILSEEATRKYKEVRQGLAESYGAEFEGNGKGGGH